MFPWTLILNLRSYLNVCRQIFGFGTKLSAFVVMTWSVSNANISPRQTNVPPTPTTFAIMALRSRFHQDLEVIDGHAGVIVIDRSVNIGQRRVDIVIERLVDVPML